jgi:hypothetical protein
MREDADDPPPSFDETRAQLHEGLDKARKLVERARFMLGGDSDESPA